MSPSRDSSSSTVSPAPAKSFQAMLDDIRVAFSRSDCVADVDELWKVLDNYQSKPSEWAKYAYYDARKYKRNLVEASEDYSVMILCWGPNTKSCIHDHSGSHCFMKILDGELIESRFAWPGEDQLSGKQAGGQEMSRISEARMGLDDVLYINDKVGLHRVENPSPSKTSASLHIYIPPITECKAFDQRTGQARKCKLTYDSMRGKIVKQLGEGLSS